MAPIIIACNGVPTSGPAVMLTNPASAPFKARVRSTLPYKIEAKVMAATNPPQAAIFVLTYTFAIAAASAALPRANCDPPLKPNHPNHNINVPIVARGKLEPGIAITEPLDEYLPNLGPIMIAPTNAAQPPTECTSVEPAKSEKPISAKKPPPQTQDPWIG